MYFDFSKTHVIFETISKLTNNLLIVNSCFQINKKIAITIIIEVEDKLPILCIKCVQKNGIISIIDEYTLYLNGVCELDTTIAYYNHLLHKNEMITQSIVYTQMQTTSTKVGEEFFSINLNLNELNSVLQSPTTKQMNPFFKEKVLTKKEKDSLTLTFEEVYLSDLLCEHLDEIIPEPDSNAIQ